ncbi:Zn(II)2Cys6 transcription factor [Aspergillus undulatus]|uniref:Zn(II)2Cys6 transcription factor n=1 Tax=Aspergillus undulatus TaxID=1810928 RepID=UPI003CCE257B
MTQLNSNLLALGMRKRESSPSLAAPQTNPPRCRRCHARKVKCSGGSPCKGCQQGGKAVECVYPRKARLVKVSEQYIENLVAENQRLRSSAAQPLVEDSAEAAAKPAALSDAPWFVNADALHTPILVAEASDSAFATRFRQAMSDGHHGHLPRVDFPGDEQLLALSDTVCKWPSPALARLLVQAALNGLGRCYHVVRRSSTLRDLENSIQNGPSLGLLSKTKLWALFAIGEVYATRTAAAGKEFPGLHYYCKTMNILRIMSERPSLELVEIHLLQSLYSIFLNRRHAAYSLAGSAVRLATIMGLHLNIPEVQMPNAGEREHRNRTWWTAYTLDRMWAAKLGYPSAIRDDEIEVDLPSNVPSPDAPDFPDRDYFVARIELAKLSGRIIHTIYGRKSQETSLSQRVQEAFADLRRWLEQLPASLQINAKAEGDLDPKARSLHLLFNQLAILATRPILLHVFRTHLEFRERQLHAETNIPASATALSQTCIRCARHSCRLLVESWMNGTFMVLDYFYTQYLFSAATVLGISSLLENKEDQSDEEQFEIAISFLLQLRDNGNYAAAEFSKHIQTVADMMRTTKTRFQAEVAATPVEEVSTRLLTVNPSNVGSMEPTLQNSMTAGAALSDPFLQELLEQPLPDLQFIDASMFLDDQQGLYWPRMAPDAFDV